MAGGTSTKKIPALKVHQWLRTWNEVAFDGAERREKPPENFFVFSLPAAELRSLCGISRRTIKDRQRRTSDFGIQRQHDRERSDEIKRFVEYGYPWSTLSEAKRRAAEFSDLKKPGWLPTAIIINILAKGEEREGEKIFNHDVVTITDKGAISEIELPYLGRAINSLLNNDPDRAVHLAYYAELRAALSVLASEGVGIFKRRHFVIDGVGSVSHLKWPAGTHDFAWQSFNYWASTKNSGALFSSVITPGGIAIADWFGGIVGVEKHLQPQAKAWFKQWSMDLRQFDVDHDARNESSYRPDGIPTAWYVQGSDALGVADAIWSACEPNPNSSFENIDRHVLRHSVHRAFLGVHGRSSADAPQEFGDFVGRLVERLNFDPAIAAMWQTFLLAQPSTNAPLIFSYSAKDVFDKSIGYAAILSRATFLLRLASGSAQKLARSAGLSSASMKFWWNDLGKRRGLTEADLDGTDLLSLWDEIEELLEQVRDFQNATPQLEQTYFKMRLDLPNVMDGLCTNERIAIWSLTP